MMAEREIAAGEFGRYRRGTIVQSLRCLLQTTPRCQAQMQREAFPVAKSLQSRFLRELEGCGRVRVVR